MNDLRVYTDALVKGLRERFGDRLLYVGLQGSYSRGEAGPESDVDILAVLDALEPADMDAYRDVLSGLPKFAPPCGFLCGLEELTNWNRCEICQLLYGTADLYGKLRPLLPAYTREDLRAYIQISVGNLYHELCHRYLYAGRERSAQRLPASCKGLFYILQNLHMYRTGSWINTKAELLVALDGIDRSAFEIALSLQRGEACDFDTAFERLLSWCKATLASLA